MVVDNQVPSVLIDCCHILKQAKDEATINKLPCDQFRNIITWCQKAGGTAPPASLCALLLEVLADCSLTLEVQALASTAFCQAITLLLDPPGLSHFLPAVLASPPGAEFYQVDVSVGGIAVSAVVHRPDQFRLCLCWGLAGLPDPWAQPSLQSLFLSSLLPLLETLSALFSPLTLLAFKSLKMWLSRLNQSDKTSSKVSAEVLSRVIKIILSNWENPMNGVREQNSLLLDQYLEACDALPSVETSGNERRFLRPAALLDLVFAEQSWMNRSKYHMLAVLLPKNGTAKVLLNMSNDIITGLLNSLCYTHLVSAGTDLYRCCLDDITYELWQQLFFAPIVKILESSIYVIQKQNIFNYWIPCTVKKFKPALQLIYESLTVCGSVKEDLLLPVVCCLKLGRKEGFEKMQWKHIADLSFLKVALQHSDEMIRAHAFAVVCVSSKATLVTDEEFNLVESFLKNNINVDSAPLRHSMLSSFVTFLCRIRDACIVILNAKFQTTTKIDDRALTRSMIFLDWLHKFLMENMELGTNYQRRFTSLEIYKIIFSYLTEDSVPTIVQRRGSLKSDRLKVMEYAIRVNKWDFLSDSSREMLLHCVSDPSSDVRESAATLLTTYFKLKEEEASRFGELYKRGLAMCSDALFYYADSGALLVQVVTSLAYKLSGQQGPRLLAITSKDERVSSWLVGLAQSQAQVLREDLLRAASQGAPLHGVLSCIHRLVLDPAGPEHNKLTEAERLKLVTLLQTVTQHLLNVLSAKMNNLSDYAASFSEMGLAIESIVEESSVSVEDSDHNFLSPAYQLVLNCIWLNLRVCCEVSSGLVSSYGAAALGEGEAWRCAEVAVGVLQACRHRGALEAAGTALAACVRALTLAGLPARPHRCLADVLGALVLRPNTPSTRAAGLVTLVHRAAAADARPSKPLVSECMKSLLEQVKSGTGDVCVALQLLAAFARDSSLSQDLAPHLLHIATLAVRCLSSPHYPVRNAALVVYGAVVPRLVGQRRRQDEEAACHLVPYEELAWRSPALLSRLVEEVESGDAGRAVAALTLLASAAVGLGAERVGGDALRRLSDASLALLAAPQAHVRALAARANAALCPASHLPSLVAKRLWPVSLFLSDRSHHTEITSENQLHGYLLNTKFLIDRFNREKIGNAALQQLQKQLDVSSKTINDLSNGNIDKISFLCRALLSEMSHYKDSKPANRQIEEIIATVSHSSASPLMIGIYSWTHQEVAKIISYCPIENLIPSLYTCLINCDNYELHKSCLASLQARVPCLDFRSCANRIVDILGLYVVTKVESVDSTVALETILDILVKHKDVLEGLSCDNLVKVLCGSDLDTRLMVKKSMKEHKENKLLHRVLHARQLGLKLIANVTYGYTSANFSGRMPCMEVGDSVVSKGRETLERVIEMVNNHPSWGARVVYGDTDSVFVLTPGKTRQEAFVIGQEIADAATIANPRPVKLKLEKVYQPCILQTKKRYVGYMYESASQEEPTYDAKGIETVRRDGCPAVSKILQKSLTILFKTKDVSQVKDYVCKQMSKLFTRRVNIQDLTFAREFRGINGYRPGACVPALKIARELVAADRRAEPRRGERVAYVVVCGPPGVPLIQLTVPPSHFFQQPSLILNAHYYILKAILPALNRCFTLLGVDVFSWCSDLPKRSHQQVSRVQLGQKKSTISQYFAAMSCVLCNQLTTSGICYQCQQRPDLLCACLASKTHRLEERKSTILKVCESCCGRKIGTECCSLDCPVLFRRVQASWDFHQTELLDQLRDLFVPDF